MNTFRSMVAAVILASLLGAGGSGAASLDMTLDYISRYTSQPGQPDHLLDAVPLDGGRAIVLGNRGLALVELAALPAGGTTHYLARLEGVNARNAYPMKDGYLVVNLNMGETGSSPGLGIVRVSGDSLEYLTTRDEPEVLYEKMAVDGDLLFVAAHAAGLRIFDVGDPSDPVLVGSLDQGFTDAWAVAVDGDTAYVADGGGGLKVVDVSEPAAPLIVAGETPESAIGTAEDVAVHDGKVYLAAGGAGLLVYDGGELGSRTVVPLDGFAKDLAWAGERLAVATATGVWVVDPSSPGGPAPVAHEITARRGNGTLRLCEGVGGLPDGRLLAADWSSMDVYQLQNLAESIQPDIDCSLQRLRFAPEGGTVQAWVWNAGGGTLVISGADVNDGAFATDLGTLSLAPGQETSFTITYAPRSSDDQGLIRIRSNDPDENPLPIQVFGRTHFLDPGEAVPDFTLPSYTADPESGELIPSTFRLSEHRGQVVWLQVYGYW